MSDELLRIESQTLCDIAQEAADFLRELCTCGAAPMCAHILIAEQIEKVAARITNILDEHPEAQDDTDSKAQFHREESKKKSIGLLVR